MFTDDQRVYYFKEFYVRTSSSEYSLSDLQSRVHLTNNSLQCTEKDYGQYEPGNTITFTNLKAELRKTYPEHDFDQILVPRIKDLVIDCYLCVRTRLNPNKRQGFELFGFDFLVDEDMRTWLIEVNTNPFLGTPNSDIAKLVP